MRAPVPARGPQAEKEREGKEGNGDARSSRAREPAESQRAREEAQGSATDGLFLYIGAPFPARGARREAEIGAGGLVVSSLGGFWACGPRSPPEGPKQRRRERRKPKGVQQTGFSYIRGPVPGKGRPSLEPEGWWSLVWVAFGLAGPGPRGPQARSSRATGTRAREEAQGSATDGLFLYIGAPFPARGARREAEIGAGGLVVSSLGGFWACGPRSPPEGPKQRRRRRRERERKATGTPEAAEPESQRGSPRECNRRAFPIYRGPVPGKGRPERSRDWSRRVGGL